MNFTNEKIIEKILTVDEPNAKIAISKWYVNRSIVEAGNNYTSEISRLTIEYEKNDDDNRHEKHIFLKVPFNSPMYEDGIKLRFYDKEGIMYEHVLPQMNNISGEYLSPRCYFLGEKQSLFLEDLTQTGFKTVNRYDQLDFDHCYHALKCLAKFHGSSLKVKNMHGIPEIVGKEFILCEGMQNDILSHVVQGLDKFYDYLDSDMEEKYSKQMEILKAINFDEIVEDINPGNNSFNVLNHGDFWTNNILFKYDGFGVIGEVKLLDFQQCRYNSPTLDLIYFTISSMRFEVFENYFDLLLNVYLDTLNKVLRSSSCGVYTIEELKNDIKKKYRFAIFVLTCLMPFMACQADKPIDIGSLVDRTDPGSNPLLDIYKQKHYVEIATKWFQRFVEKDIFGFQLNDEATVKNSDRINSNTKNTIL